MGGGGGASRTGRTDSVARRPASEANPGDGGREIDSATGAATEEGSSETGSSAKRRVERGRGEGWIAAAAAADGGGRASGRRRTGLWLFGGRHSLVGPASGRGWSRASSQATTEGRSPSPPADRRGRVIDGWRTETDEGDRRASKAPRRSRWPRPPKAAAAGRGRHPPPPMGAKRGSCRRRLRQLLRRLLLLLQLLRSRDQSSCFRFR